jgi:hypothetical protein
MSEDAYRAYLANRQANGDAGSRVVMQQRRTTVGRGSY